MAFFSFILTMGMLVAGTAVYGQSVIRLYGAEVPNRISFAMEETLQTSANGIAHVTGVTIPTLTAYFPPPAATNTGKAVIICPGGSYRMLVIDHEGHEVARRFAANGITAFVLKYRLPRGEIMVDKRIGPLQDAQRAIQLVRERASEWGIAADQIGIAGFSAGGHLAASLSTHYRDALIPNPQGTSFRPDFSLLLYPVISMRDRITHGGSRRNLLGDQATVEDIGYFSNEEQVTEDTPPAFLVHAEDDNVVLIANSEVYRAALERHGVPAKLITYPIGGHGFGLHNDTTKDSWFDHFLEWLAGI